ncbi:hypothetical protein PFICI_04229 [Pestalotiopsis fici W106-1]|uniref:SET domain-containing protein n=1 Tax=Pestalotiopsis fici (strain W106-1 / CGMCC3.15140) TaxID=1229662 RepID=W3X8A6_PESFW|nr:uncharacterized protein PFICI_04229 [Pestalotiopsis fici W106-1]ETS82353.1 hypothetical protein PFICI_04229 [Pestalotiopsis fici W106-1]
MRNIDELPIDIPSSPLSSTSWEIRPSPGKGLGVFAKSPIRTGQRIMVEAPLFAITPPQFVPGKGYELSAMAASVDAAVASLSPADRNVFHSCHAHYLPGEAAATEEPGSGADMRRNRNMVIFRSNAYTLTNGSVAMFPQIARINHACRPNAANVWSAASDRRIIWAARDIAAGEEVTVTYAPLLKARSDRQARLAPYGFTCDCEACRDNDPEGTDRSRVRMGRLLAELEERLAQSTSGAANKRLLPKALELVQLLEKEHMMDYLPNAYHLAAELAHRMEDSAAAMTWSEKALQLHRHADEISHAAMGEQSYLDRVRM